MRNWWRRLALRLAHVRRISLDYWRRPLTRRACLVQLFAMVALTVITARFNDEVGRGAAFAGVSPEALPMRTLGAGAFNQLNAHHERVMMADAVLVLGYGAVIIVGCFIAVRLVQEPVLRKVLEYGLFAAGATLVAGWLCDALWLTAAWSHRHTSDSHSLVDWLLRFSAASAIVKFSGTAIGGFTAIMGFVVGVSRAFSPKRNAIPPAALVRPLPVEPGDVQRTGARSSVEIVREMAGASSTIGGATIGSPLETGTHPARDGSARARWVRGYRLPNEAIVIDDARSHQPIVGICLSGGGVRAAAFALGTLQSKTFRQVLNRARYLVSVSGGAYTAGALQMALTTAGNRKVESGTVIREPGSVYMPGTAEEDHLRRHSSYLASTPSELILAIGLLLRHLVLNLALLFAPAVVAGIAVGTFYRYVPATPIRLSSSSSTPRIASSGDMWGVTGIAVGSVLALAVLLWLLAQIGGGTKDWRRVRTVCLAGSRQLTVLAIGAFAVAVVFASVIAYTLTIDHKTHVGSHVPLTASVGVAVSYVASLFSFAWRKRSALAEATGSVRKMRRLPAGFANMSLVVLTLIVLGAAWLLAAGGAANATLQAADGSAESLIVGAGLLGCYVAALLFVDITAISLHPFYRRQLARTFATRRVYRDGHVLAEPYPHKEPTPLQTHGARCEGMPEILFAASASLQSGRTPVGYNRVSYVFGGTWIGGPEVGYVQTEQLSVLCKPQILRDLTVQGAVAVSGAAIAASAGGQNAHWYETLYTVTGVRLGAWLPNPSYLAANYPAETPSTTDAPTESVDADQSSTWASASIPRVRRFSYLLRELFGLHAFVAPMVHVSDGGFYDNLGMVELFRRRCTEIYCIDSSGGTTPAAGALAHTLTLAHEELGVDVEWDSHPWALLTPGNGQPNDPADPLGALSARLSQSGVIRAAFRYPDECGVAGLTGVLVVAKAALWRDLPYPLLAYAYRDPAFPHETTANQWFDDASLSAYLGLGRQAGAAMVTRMDEAATAATTADATTSTATDQTPRPPAKRR